LAIHAIVCGASHPEWRVLGFNLRHPRGKSVRSVSAFRRWRNLRVPAVCHKGHWSTTVAFTIRPL